MNHTSYIWLREVDGKPQRLNEVLSEIPTNVILNKTVTGCGATYTEIKTPRNSIIVEPNRPVIYGKERQEKHKDDNIKGVYQGIYQKDIVKYLEKTRREGKFIKIMTTPESFQKVIDALEEVGIDIRFECFVLFDECEKLTKDCDYRQDITLPMDLFFECQNKAMVSATPITELSDPRFKSFKEIKIEPTYDYKQDLNLITTNNVLQVSDSVIHSVIETGKPLFIFINSTDMIHALIEKLNLVEQSAVFCSEKSVDKLKQLKFKAAYEDWDAAKMKQVNWMTSRFYSALDIELDEQPNVLMITDVYIAQWTMFDPITDSVQVVGRFRNGVSSFTHISNCDYRIPYHTRLFFQTKCECDKAIYEEITTFYNNAPSPEYRAAYYDVLQVLPYKKFLKEDGQVNYFKIDNYIDEELTKVYYGDPKRLFKAYEQGEHFNVKFDNIKPFKAGDFERLRIEDKSISLKEKRRRIVEQLEMLGKCETEADIQYKRDLRAADAFIVDAYDQIGKKDIEEYGFSVTKIKEAVIVKRHQEKASSRDVVELVNLHFKEGRWYSRKYIKTILDEIYTKMDVPRPRAVTSGNIREFFTAVEKNKKDGKGYLLLTRKFEC